MTIKNNGGLILSIIFIILALSISLRIYVEFTHYLSPDSDFYLRVAENIKSGKGPIAPTSYPFNELTNESHFAIWPIGYPLLIAALSTATNTSTFISSKLVNLIFLGLLLLLLFKWFGKLSWIPALYFFSYGKLEVYSYTWSEGPFLFFVMLLCFFLDRDMKNGNTKYTFLHIFLLLISLFLLRYAGLIFFFMVAGWMIWNYFKKNYRTSFHYFTGLLLASIFVLAYFYYNKFQTGYFTGGQRAYIWDESFSSFFNLLIKGLINELLLARNYWGIWDLILIFTSSIQLLVVIMIIQKRKEFKGSLFHSNKNIVLIIAGVFYLFSIIILRKVSPFDTFDYRILAPFSTTIFIALFASITEPQNTIFLKSTYKWIVGFMVFSLLMNLPKIFLINFFYSLV